VSPPTTSSSRFATSCIPATRPAQASSLDALGAAAAIADADPRVEQVLLCTPDKDLAQCVRGRRVVQLDRRKGATLDAAGVARKFGVEPASIPDYLALVGDSADGFPGLPGWGAKSAATVLARYRHLEEIPERANAWDVKVRGASVASDVPGIGAVDDWRWRGPAEELDEICDYCDAPRAAERAARQAARRR
jgi:5'-3' exonuclease